MTTRPLDRDDPLDDFDRRTIRLLGTDRLVYVTGGGPAVIVMTEMPGISPHVARFARWVRDAGFTVYMPHTLWLRALAALAHDECGGKGVGAIGMCFTGNFALSMMLEPAVLAPVLAQPSLPLNDPAGMHIAPDELAAVKARMEAEDLTVLAYRFAGDKFCKAARFAAYEDALGERFVGRVLPDEAANPDSPMKNPHSVVTIHLIDEAGQPTVQARDEILDFFKMRLSD